MSVVTRIRTSQELTVPFPPAEVWAVLADVAAYPDWWPAKLGVEVLHHTGELLGAEFEVRPVLGRMFRIRFEELEGMRSMRLRFFGGSLEGPGGFHLHALDGATQVRYEMDVFARGLDVAVLSQLLPLERIHQSRMRSVLRSLAGRLKTLRKAADRRAAQAARSVEQEAAIRRQAEEEAAARLADEGARRQAERDAAARAAAEEAEHRAAEEEVARLAAEAEARRQAEAEEAARLAAEEAARKRAAEEAAAHRAAEEDERRAMEEAAARLAAEESRSRAEEEAAARLAAEGAERRAAEEEAARLAAHEEARRQAEAEEAARQAAEESRKRAEEEAAARFAAEEAERRAAQEEAARRAAEVEARRRAEAEEAARLAAEEEARRRADEWAAARVAAEEAARRAAQEAERRTAEDAERRAGKEAAARAVAHEAAPDVSGDVDHAAAEQRATGSRPRPLWGRIVNWLREAPAAPTPSGPAEEPADPPAPGPGHSNFDIARLYLEALASRATPGEIEPFFSPEATQEEFPHRFLAATARRGFDGILEARSSALARFGSQRYELAGATGGGSQVAMEVRWKGSVATTGGGFTAGQELDARLAVFLKFADGKIVRERIYACFEPWSTRAERRVTLDERVAQAGQSTHAPTQGPGQATMEPMGSNFEIARRYLDALGARADAEAIARFHAADAVEDEFPNRFLPGGAHRDLQAIKLARSRGLALMASESYELLGATGGGSQVALEAAWSGVVGEGLGLFAAGQRLEARLGIFLKFRDGLIVARRNYTASIPAQ